MLDLVDGDQWIRSIADEPAVLRRELCKRYAADAAVGPLFVAASAPVGEDVACPQQGLEPMLNQALVPELAVEVLDEAGDFCLFEEEA